MLKMFESFTTGQPAEKNWNSSFTPPATPKPKKKTKKPSLTVIDGDKKDSDDNDDLEWI